MVKIRKSTLKDCEACHKIANMKELLVANGDVLPADYFRNLIRDKGIFLVAVYEGEVVGFISGETLCGDGAFFMMIGVYPSRRNKGIGKLLYEGFEDECKKLGVKWILAYGAKGNAKTMEFHKKNGFILGAETIEMLKELG